MRDGADVIYQAAFADGAWRGLADFVVRQPDGGYEVVDTKLARHARPAHVLQLCFYTEQIARIQGRMPRAMHVVNGLGERETFRPDDYLAYYRRLRERFLAAVENGAPTYPYPVEHCGLCDFLSLCQQQWEEDDHLTLVAGVSRAQVERLDRRRDHDARGARRRTARHARPQDARRRPSTTSATRPSSSSTTGAPASTASICCPSRTRPRLRAPARAEPGRHLARPRRRTLGSSRRAGSSISSAGSSSTRTAQPRYECLWAHDRDEEKQAFERLVDTITERRRRFPGMHVYHYAPYEAPRSSA